MFMKSKFNGQMTVLHCTARYEVTQITTAHIEEISSALRVIICMYSYFENVVSGGNMCVKSQVI